MNEWIWLKWRCHRNCCRGTVQKSKDGIECQRGNDAANRWVFRCRQKEASNDVDWTLGGKEFQARAAATGNDRSPRVDRWVDGTTSVDVLADPSRRWVSTSVDRWSVSERYDGARPCRHRNARTHNLTTLYEKRGSTTFVLTSLGN